MGSPRTLRRQSSGSVHGRNLTATQMKVFEMLTQAYSAKDMANELGISVKTAETHKYDVFRRLGIHSRREAVALAPKIRIRVVNEQKSINRRLKYMNSRISEVLTLLREKRQRKRAYGGDTSNSPPLGSPDTGAVWGLE